METAPPFDIYKNRLSRLILKFFNCKSLIFATKGNKVKKGLIICEEKAFPCSGFSKNHQKKLYYKQTRENFSKSLSYCESDPVKI